MPLFRWAHVSVLRPVPSLNYVRKYQATLLFMLVAMVLFFLACVLRLALRVRVARRTTGMTLVDEEAEDTEGEESTSAPRWSFWSSPSFRDFKQRMQHSVLILASILSAAPPAVRVLAGHRWPRVCLCYLLLLCRSVILFLVTSACASCRSKASCARHHQIR